MSSQQVLQFAALSDTGLVREHNEDAIIVCADYGCAVLADGMGGYRAGEVASAMSARLITDYLCARLAGLWSLRIGWPDRTLARWMLEAVELANRCVLQASQTDAACQGMGTTVVTACFSYDKLLLAHVGDSRAYRYRSAALTRLTHDHSVLQEQIDAGLISEADARFSSIKNLITRAVGTQDDIDVEITVHAVQADDLYLLCSDGLTDMLTPDEIAAILQRHQSDLTRSCRVLVDCANAEGGKDNCSVVLFKVVEVGRSSWLRRLLTR